MPQIPPLNSPFHRAEAPNGLLVSGQRMYGPAVFRFPEAPWNLPVPEMTLAELPM